MIRILSIEDDENQRKMLKESVDTYNISKAKTEDEEIVIDFQSNADNIGNMIFLNKYDCLIVDINLGPEKQEEGRNLILNIINKKRIPIMVYSAKLTQIEDLDESFGFRKFDRADNFHKVLDEIVKVKNTRVFDLLGYDGYVDENINKIFWEDIDASIKAINVSDEIDSKALTRIIITRIINKLDLSEQLDSNYKYYEFYINPSLTDDCCNGDIYHYNDNYYLVITPECQLRKMDTVSLVKIDFNMGKTNEIIKKEKEKRGKNEVKNNITKPECYLHYIPPFNTCSHGFINFRDIVTVRKEELNNLKVITINPKFMKNIQSRFAQYYSRQGQPDIDYDNLYELLKKMN